LGSLPALLSYNSVYIRSETALATQNIDQSAIEKNTFIYQKLPVFISAIILIISVGFCAGNFYVFSNYITNHREFAILVPHSQMMRFLLVAILPQDPIAIILLIWAPAGIALTVISRTMLGKIAVISSFIAAIPFAFMGLIFGLLVPFSPIDSLVVESKSFNLGYFDDSSGGGNFYLYECNLQGFNCKEIWQSRSSSYDPLSANNVELDEGNRQLKIFIRGQLVYTHPIE
jgi:hypothetical protein